MRPGITYFPEPSTTRASLGMVMIVPTAAIFPSRCSIVALRSAGPFIVRTVSHGHRATIPEPLALNDRIVRVNSVRHASFPDRVGASHDLFLQADADEQGHADDVDRSPRDLVRHLVRLRGVVEGEIESKLVLQLEERSDVRRAVYMGTHVILMPQHAGDRLHAQVSCRRGPLLPSRLPSIP